MQSRRGNNTLNIILIILLILLILFLIFLALDYYLHWGILLKNPTLSADDEEVQASLDCVYGEWGDWGDCDKECGSGQQSRNRSIISEATGSGVPCDQNQLTESQDCNTQACPRTEETLETLVGPGGGHAPSGVSKIEGNTYCNFTGDDYAVGFYGTEHQDKGRDAPTAMGLVCASGNRSPLLGTAHEDNPAFEYTCPNSTAVKGANIDLGWTLRGMEGVCDDADGTILPHMGGYRDPVAKTRRWPWHEWKCPGDQKLVGLHGWTQGTPPHDRFGYVGFVCGDINPTT